MTDTAALTKRLLEVRRVTEAICAPLLPEDTVVQPIVDVSPPKWHLGHTTWFFEQFLLVPNAPNYKLFHPEFHYVFNSYYESLGARMLRTDRGNLSRPGLSEILKYREHVNLNLGKWLFSVDSLPEELMNIIELGIQHEQQHQELLITDIKYILGHNPLFPAYHADQESILFPEPHDSKVKTETEFLQMETGLYAIGFESEGFCFDNELGAHQVYLGAYQIASKPVTNRDFLKFMEAGGYQDFSHWLAEGWDWVKQQQLTAPLYWHQVEGKWLRYSLSGLGEVDLDAPVTHISFYEADAYAKWRDMRLPTEFEWEAACKKFTLSENETGNFQESQAFEPLTSTNNNPQFFGDVWEWTASAYQAYPGYRRASGALGEYNGKFMINQMVLRGGSCATPKSHIRPSYRNFFHPDKRWQFTGIRLAASL